MADTSVCLHRVLTSVGDEQRKKKGEAACRHYVNYVACQMGGEQVQCDTCKQWMFQECAPEMLNAVDLGKLFESPSKN